MKRRTVTVTIGLLNSGFNIHTNAANVLTSRHEWAQSYTMGCNQA
jgi:hypothetical protein